MTNHFSIEVSKALRAIGVEGETENYWYDEHQIVLSNNQLSTIPLRLVTKSHRDSVSPQDEFFPAYTLHDILRLMPKIGEKMGWIPPESEYDEGVQAYEEHSHHLLDAFLEKDYAGAEQFLMSIITKEHE